MPDPSTDSPNNFILYQHIQLAYDYVTRMSAEPMWGEPLAVLSKLYRARVRSVLENRQTTQQPPDSTFQQVREWFRDERAKKASDIIVGRIEDFEIGSDSPDLFHKNQEQYWEGFQLDRARLEELGLESYATYLPIHFFFSGDLFDTDWGIYISEEGMLHLAAVLSRACKLRFGSLTPERDGYFVEMAYQILLRHELEHFKVESFALNAELTLGKPLYAPYLTKVYAEVYHTDSCLEEALANGSVLDSRVIHNLFNKKLHPPPPGKKPTSRWREIIANEFFSNQPPGYSNYGLRRGWHDQDDPFWQKMRRRAFYSEFGGGYDENFDSTRRRRAMNFLCNQILQSSPNPVKRDVPFFAFLPDNYFLRAENLVPIHIVTVLDKSHSFIQIPTPPRKLWEKFLRKMGYYPVGRGKGDHEVWECPGLGQVTVNYHDKELDWNSFKSSLRTLGLTIRDFQHYKQSGKLPVIKSVDPHVQAIQ
ncbi:MAG TPA: type II toxin-antitoxin system HicA family toxin [Anaerolineae bacterium]|nr:type II toxin-antitoxin system HicA family toxin [Anaerolineae bacterium]